MKRIYFKQFEISLSVLCLLIFFSLESRVYSLNSIKTELVTGCSISSLTAVPGSCNSTTNAYTVTGTVQFTNPPSTGTLTVQISGGGSQVFNAPFGTSKDYSITNQAADGASHTVTATFSANSSCTKSKTYVSPASCMSCPSNSCLSNDLLMNGNMETGTPPSSWVVASGTPSSEWTLGTGSSTGDFGVLNNDDDNTDRYIEQYITTGIVANRLYMLNALAATHDPKYSNAIAELYMEFYNGSTLLATSSKSNTTFVYNGSLQALATISMTAPANTNKVRIVGHSRGRALKIDNVTLKVCYEAIGIKLVSKTNATCSQNIGQIVAAASGGSGVYEYSKDNNTWQSTGTFSNLAAGVYTIYTRDKNLTTCNKASIQVQIELGSTSDCSGEICFIGKDNPSIASAKLTWTTDPVNGTVKIRATLAKTFVDNTYGTNAIGWPSGNHEFKHLTGSDKLELTLYNKSNAKVMEFAMDYITASTAAPSGYKSLGVSGGDGSMIFGSAADIVNIVTSLDVNFNQYNYVLTTNSPSTDANYTPNPSYPNWIYDVWYEATVKLSAFGTSGFGRPLISDLHASPSKTGSNTEPLDSIKCNLCSVSNLSANPGTCDSQNNSYKVTGSVSFTSSPNTGTLTISDGASQQVFSAPFTSPQSYTLTGLSADGAVHTVTAVFSADANCKKTATYTAPTSCVSCPSDYCKSSDLVINGNMEAGNPPTSWVVANGTPSSEWTLGTGSSTGDFGILNNNDDNTDRYIEQFITTGVVPNRLYTLDALAATHSAAYSNSIAELYLEFYNGSTLLATSSKSNTTFLYNGTLKAIATISMYAPSNTTKIRIVGHSRGRALKVDNIVLISCYPCACVLTDITANPGTCNPSTNNYTLSGSVSFSNPPTTGTLTVQIAGGGSQVFNAPFSSPVNYSIANQVSDGASHTVTAAFSADPNCSKSKTYNAPPNCECSISTLNVTVGTCNPSTNNYTLSGSVNFSNPPTTGTLTVQIAGGGSQIFNAPFSSPVNYSIANQVSDGASHTVTATFSADPNCAKSKTYNAPPNCECSISTLNVTVGTCNPSTNNYTLSGSVSFSNPPTTGTLTVQIAGGGSQVFNAPFPSPVNYSIANQVSDGVSHTVTATFSADPNCARSKTYTAPPNCECSISTLNVTVGTCNPSTNNYTLSGSVSFSNPPTTGTLTVQIAGGGSQVFNAPFSSPINYSIANQVSDGASHTVTATFSADPNCAKSKTYTAPPNCECSISTLNVTVGTCNPSTNAYTLSGSVSFSNPPTTGTLTVQIAGGGSQVFNAPFSSPINYSIANQVSDGVSHTVTATFSADPNCAKSKTYNAPPNCECSLTTLNVTVGTCDPFTNNYALSGSVSFINPPTTGTLTIQIAGGGSQVFNAPFSSPVNYSIANQVSDGASHTVTATFSADPNCAKSKTYTAPPSCTCSISTLNVNVGTCNPTTNKYNVSGSVSFTNPPSTGTLTIQVVGGGSQVFSAPFGSPINYNIANQVSDGLVHTVTATFSADPNCTKSKTYTAPPSCECAISTLNVNVGACNPLTSTYTLTGSVTFSNPPSTGTLTIQIVGGGSQVFSAPFGSPINFSISNQTSDGASHTVTATFSADPECTKSKTYTAPPNCDCSISSLNLTVGSCNPATNNYSLSGSVGFINAPSTGTLTIQIVGGGFQIFSAPFASPVIFNIANQVSDGLPHTVTATFSVDPNCSISKIYTAPPSCVCSISTLNVNVGTCNPATNNYNVSGSVTFTNPPSTGTLTVQIVGGGSQVFSAPFGSPINYSIVNQLSDGLSHTITASFSADPNCAKSKTYIAPPNCECSVNNLNVTVGACNPLTNNYTVSGSVSFSNPPGTGTLTVQIVGGGSQVFNAPFASPVVYNIANQLSDGLLHTVTASFSAEPNCAKSKTYTAPPDCECSMTALNVTVGSCNTTTNNYNVSGSVVFTNPPTTGTLTIQIAGGGSQVFSAPFASPVIYNIANQVSDGLTHTITATFSADPNCARSRTYTAPPSCTCSISTLNVNVGTCNPSTNSYTVSGSVTFTNPPSTGTLTIQVVGGGSQIFSAPFGSPINYSIANQPSDGLPHTVTATFSADPNCAKSKTYTAPPDCDCSLSTLNVNVGTCNPETNSYTVSGSVTFINPPSTGTLTVQIVGGGSQVYSAPFGSPINYSIANQVSDGLLHTITATFSADPNCAKSKTYTAPPNCECTISTLNVTVGACNTTTNNYSVSGSVVFTNPPTTGTLTVEVVGGGSQVFNAPFASPVNYSISNLSSDGLAHIVTATFSADPNCTRSKTYNAPPACVSCPNDYCKSDDLLINGNMEAGSPPSSWVVANGTPSSEWTLGTGSSTGDFGILNNNDDNTDRYIEQYVTTGVVPDRLYILNALAATHSPAFSNSIAELYMEFYNGNTLIATSSKSNTTHLYNGTLQPVATITMYAPANSTKIRIVGHSRGRALKLDNIVLKSCYPCTPQIEHEKVLVGITPTGINTYMVEYRITVQNKGTGTGQYNLSDAPNFDNDINIISASYFSNASGNPGNPGPLPLAGSGPWTLATNQNISGNGVQTFNIQVNVSINLEDASGDNRYDYCGKSLNKPRVGEGLFNESRLDIDRDGQTDARDTACADLPYLIHTKRLLGVSPVGGLNNYLVEYQIDVRNIGGAPTQYNLSDAPNFENDITINAANYSSNATGNPANPGPVGLAGIGPWLLASNQNIAAGVTQSYVIKVNVSIDLLDVSGDNRYDACGRSSGKPKIGEGLFNESRLDINRDGITDARDTACADLPFLIHKKRLVGVTNTALNTFLVEYRITVENIGGTTTQYNLVDAPAFDNDININSADYSSNAIGNPGNPGPVNLAGSGPWTLATNQSIVGGGVQNYNLRVSVTLNLNDASGDNRYDECGKSIRIPKAGEGLFNESRLDINRDGTPDRRDTACADIPFILHTKKLVGVTNTGLNSYQVEYQIAVENKGGISALYNLYDAPNFDNDIAIASANYYSNAAGNIGNPGPVNLAGTGPWTLATNQSIAGGAVQTYNIRINVNLNLEDASGDNRYDECGYSLRIPRVGEGLFNESRLDIDRDGIIDQRDTACADLPYITHKKFVVGVTPTGLNTYEVVYRITVENKGGLNAQYSLVDAPAFDNDVTILGSNYSSNAPGNIGNPGPINLPGVGPWLIANFQGIATGTTHTYFVRVNVSINLADGVGDNRYDYCGRGAGIPRAGEGLFNEARMDAHDGYGWRISTVCTDIPLIEHHKEIIGVTNTGINSYRVDYRITVENKGGVAAQYNLSDAPNFDNDISTTSANYSSNAAGNPANPGPVNLFGTGPWTLATNQSIAANSIQTYTLRVNVNLNLEDAIGDNRYDECGHSLGIPRIGEGLFNESRLDIDRDGITDQRDTACADLPYLVHKKSVIGVTPTGVNTYEVAYKIVVENKGGLNAQYSLVDAPAFDNDITILSTSFSSNAPGNIGNPGPINLGGFGPWLIANFQGIAIGATHTYIVRVNVSINLTDGVGDNRYDYCGRGIGVPRAGEGLYNEAKMDAHDGYGFRISTVCTDIPIIEHTKSLIGVTPTGLNTYMVDYRIVVENKGGVATQYNLSDAPSFDNDININSASYSSNAIGNIGNPGPVNLGGFGPWVLASNQSIPAYSSQVYNLRVFVTMNLDDASGDNRYDECGKSLRIPRSGEGLFNESRLDIDRDGITDQRDTACADLPYIVHKKSVIGVTPTGPNTYEVAYRIVVENKGGINTQYTLEDAPAFDNDITILNTSYSSNAPGNIGNPGPVNLVGNGPWTLASFQSINYGTTHTYIVRVNVSLNLTDGVGDNRYDYCGRGAGIPRAGEGLFNEARLNAHDGYGWRISTVCTDIPVLEHKKRLVGVTSTGINTFVVDYRITVENKGGIATQYNLSDVPNFDNDIVITSASYSSDAVGNAGNPGPVFLIGTGPYTLATNQNIASGGVQTYNIRINVSMNLEDATGDNRYDQCGKTQRIPRVGEGLFNESRLDIDRDGIPDQRDTACADLPYITHEKVVSNVIQTGARTYQVEYRINVKNVGSAFGFYGLVDRPDFDSDITINSATYFSNAPGNAGNPGPYNLIGSGPWTLATNQSIGAGVTQIYTLRINVTINLEDGFTGNNIYEECGKSLKIPKSGEGLFNESLLDINNDGTPDRRDSACYDLPYIVHNKSIIDVVSLPDNNFRIVYGIEVKNIGGAAGQYDLTDLPGFDDDVMVLNASFATNATGHPANPGPYSLFGSGPWVLANDQTINAFSTQFYTLTVNVNIDLTDPQSPGDEIMRPCGYRIPGVPSAGEGFFNQTALDVNNDGEPDQRDSVCYDIKSACLGDRVWNDLEPNGVQEAGEPGVKDVIAILYDCSNGALVRRDTTDFNGNYFFCDLTPGKDYFVRFDLSLLTQTYGFTTQNEGSNDAVDSDVNASGFGACTHIDVGEIDSTYDAGLIQLATIADFVWLDCNSDGKQSFGETGIQGVTVTLYDAVTKTVVKTMVTDANGLYIFKDLVPKDYYVKFQLPAGYVFTTANSGAEFEDSDVDNSNGPNTTATTHLSPGETDRTWDVGVIKCSTVAGDVWFDVDADGIYDLEEKGINGLLVHLVDAFTGKDVDKVFTGTKPGSPSDDGYFKFYCVKPGQYFVRFEKPGTLSASLAYQGTNRKRDSDITHENGLNTTQTFLISMDGCGLGNLVNPPDLGDLDEYIGGGFQNKTTLGNNTVWVDANSNGIREDDEAPLPGVKVLAYNMQGDVVSEGITDSEGQYVLNGLVEGEFYVKFEIPSEKYAFTKAHSGNDKLDSDVDGAFGYGTTKLFNITPGESMPNIDAGVVGTIQAIDWFGFKGNYNGEFMELDWTTGVETNTDYFIVERRFESEKGFKEISRVDASGNSGLTRHSYEFDDFGISSSGMYYYRLKQMNKNGAFVYSQTISVHVNSASTLDAFIYPNPVYDVLKIEMWIPKDSDLEVKVFDLNGKAVLVAPFNAFKAKGKYNEFLEITSLNSGQYELQIKTSSGVIHKKFTVSK